MLSRREWLAGGVAGGLAGSSEEAFAQTADREGQREITRALQSVEATLRRTVEVAQGTVPAIRRNLEQFLRANGRFPEFMEIGTAVFFDIYDWHIRNRQPIVVTRQVDNRYTIQFMLTTLVMSVSNEPNYIGYPYDKG